MHKLRFLILIALLIGTGTACSAQDENNATTEPVQEEKEISSAVLDTIRAQMEAIGSVRSLLVQQNNQRLIEQYYHGMQPDRKMNTKSASKSIIALLIGIAVDKGIIESVDDPIAKYLPQYFEEITDPTKEAITIKNALTMTTGLETTSFGNYGAWVVSNDWVTYALNQPVAKEPGDDQIYSTGTSHLLSVIITETSGMDTRAFANKFLFEPMNIEPGQWTQGPQGYYMGGNNLALNSEAMMKIGQMVLNGGEWNGKRIISEEWIKASLQSYSHSNYNPYYYGYMWWNREVGGYKTYFAWGYGGQYIFIIPELKAVIVITSSLDTATQSRSYKEPVFNVLSEYLIQKVLAE